MQLFLILVVRDLPSDYEIVEGVGDCKVQSSLHHLLASGHCALTDRRLLNLVSQTVSQSVRASEATTCHRQALLRVRVVLQLRTSSTIQALNKFFTSYSSWQAELRAIRA